MTAVPSAVHLMGAAKRQIRLGSLAKVSLSLLIAGRLTDHAGMLHQTRIDLHHLIGVGALLFVWLRFGRWHRSPSMGRPTRTCGRIRNSREHSVMGIWQVPDDVSHAYAGRPLHRGRLRSALTAGSRPSSSCSGRTTSISRAGPGCRRPPRHRFGRPRNL